MHLIFFSEETNEQSVFDFILQKVKQNGNMSAFELWLHKADSKCKILFVLGFSMTYPLTY